MAQYYNETEKSEKQVAGPGPLPLHHHRDAAFLPDVVI